MQKNELNYGKYVSIGVMVGLVLGGFLGFMAGILLDESPLFMILGAGGGMVIGLATGRAWSLRTRKRVP